MYRHIKGSDLNFAGISMGFAGMAIETQCPTGDCVSRSSYERPDAKIPLADGRRVLHAVLAENGALKLTLIDSSKVSGTDGVELGWASLRMIQDAIRERKLQIGGQTLLLVGGDKMRQIQKLVSRAMAKAT